MTELEVSDLISVKRAMALIDAVPVRPRPVRLPLAQATGLRLAEDLRADRDSPPFDKSLMDGYAVRAADLAAAPCELHLIGRIAAGESAISPLLAGTTMAIMTGAPLPDGADAVVPIEHTDCPAGSASVRFHRPTVPGRYIAPRGSDIHANAVVLQAGDRLAAAQIAVAASIGAAIVPVYAAPSVAVLGSGDELVAVDRTPAGAQIRSSNNAMLLALLKNYPCRPVDLGFVPDHPPALRQKILAGLECDILLITGGMSMGQRDYVPGILRELGGQLKITKLRIKPGKPFIFAQMPQGKFAFGLPGNPLSAFVCALCFVSRLLERAAGGSPPIACRLAPLASPLEANGNRAFYQPARFDGKTLAPLPWKGSADIFTLARANALLVRPENLPAQEAGATGEFIELPGGAGLG